MIFQNKEEIALGAWRETIGGAADIFRILWKQSKEQINTPFVCGNRILRTLVGKTRVTINALFETLKDQRIISVEYNNHATNKRTIVLLRSFYEEDIISPFCEKWKIKFE